MTMITPTTSLLKYDNPVLISKMSDRKSQKGRPLVVSPQQGANAVPVPPPPKTKHSSGEHRKLENEEVLHTILPPREWTDEDQLWVQRVSSAPCTRDDIINLEEQMDIQLQQRQARDMGICPVRRELYSQCFDELIRQVTINCAERGLMLVRVRNEIQMTLAVYRTLYESGTAFGMRKALQAEQGNIDIEKGNSELENEKGELMKQLNEQKAKCDAIEKREQERRQIDEKKRIKEIEFLKRSNQQLKTQLEMIITSKK